MQVAKRGRAALAICSTVFVGMGRMQSKALGMPALPIVEIPHPFGIRSREEVRALAERCADEVARLMGEGAAR